MEKSKLYFKSIDDTMCQELDFFIHDAKLEELTEITLIEAVPDNNTSDHIWCTADGECVERSRCKKSQCESYESKSGRGVCEHRGHLYHHGEEVKFKVE
ncbi:hypothetical protein [Flavobacterium sp.]|uniref:hypothetical protein n=1 Tax=Flavobacterium sp. TaxID=239 RepID=UPI003D6BF68A